MDCATATFNFTFPVFYWLALYNRSSFPQKKTVSKFLSYELDDSTISNYVRGKKAISKSLLEEIKKDLSSTKKAIEYCSIRKIDESCFCIGKMIEGNVLVIHDTREKTVIKESFTHSADSVDLFAALFLKSLFLGEPLEVIDKEKKETLLSLREKALDLYPTCSASSGNDGYSSPQKEQRIIPNIRGVDISSMSSGSDIYYPPIDAIAETTYHTTAQGLADAEMDAVVTLLPRVKPSLLTAKGILEFAKENAIIPLSNCSEEDIQDMLMRCEYNLLAHPNEKHGNFGSLNELQAFSVQELYIYIEYLSGISRTSNT